VELISASLSAICKAESCEEFRQVILTLLYGIPYTTTVAGAKAMAMAIKEQRGRGLSVKSLQEYHRTNLKMQ
jgi:carbamoyl-phosphate synthase large subunit